MERLNFEICIVWISGTEPIALLPIIHGILTMCSQQRLQVVLAPHLPRRLLFHLQRLRLPPLSVRLSDCLDETTESLMDGEIGVRAACASFTFASPIEAPAAMSLPVVSSNGCPKCGTVQQSGALSCCARGGAWFTNCGDTGDTKFDHTWVEGIQACKGCRETMLSIAQYKLITYAQQSSIYSYDLVKHGCCCCCAIPKPALPTEESTRTSLSAVSSISRCDKCGATKQPGKRSCCARGGDWFNNCGNPGDTKFDHTWAEGIIACKSKLWTD